VTRNLTTGVAPIARTLRLGQTTPWVPFPWALVETNWDFWGPLPYPDVDPRRTVIVDRYTRIGQDAAASVDGLLATLSVESVNSTATHPVNGVLNVATIFSVIMVPANSTLRSYLRHSNGCCG